MIKPLIGIFPDISPHFNSLKTLVEYKTKLLAYDITKGTEGIEDLLDREESWVYSRTWYAYWGYREDVWKLYFLCYGVPELCNFRYIFRKRGFQFTAIQSKFVKKWAWSFGDYLHEGAKTATPATWPTVVEACYKTGFNKAWDWYKMKQAGFVANLIQEFVYHFFGTKLEAFAIKALEIVTKPLQASIPSPLNVVVEIDTIAEESVVDALHQTIEKLVVDSILEPGTKLWAASAFAK